ncbi:DUF7933 domain-containing protein [Comamonas odontotermitis]|uniref:DUF7933 domain-containing protein n=1 Tax=Comamonas odontotermitis TaxID=379895 RepID=UPI001CC8212C|nr:SdrD B-like domain-containing protein [Comamonas odontotermitis]UBB17378.1 DUF11 domain-containing protein [Comamonas odontotermitis]
MQGSVAGSYTNTIPANGLITSEGLTNPSPATAPINVLNDLRLDKTLIISDQDQVSSTDGVAVGTTFTVHLKLTNWSTAARTNASITDNLPSSLVVASVPNVHTTCGGSSTAAPGNSNVTVTGMTVPAANPTIGELGICDIYFNVTVTSAALGQPIVNYVPRTNVHNDQNVLPTFSASASTGPTYDPGPNGDLEAHKAFMTETAYWYNSTPPAPFPAVGQPVYLEIGVLNRFDRNITGGTVTDVLPLGIQVAANLTPGVPYTLVNNVDVQYNSSNWVPPLTGYGPNANATPASTCSNTGVATVTRSATGQDTITYSGWDIDSPATLPSVPTLTNGLRCFVSVKVVAVAPGNYVAAPNTNPVPPNKPYNLIPANTVATDQGVTNNSPKSDTLVVPSNVSVVKAFNSATVTSGTHTARLTIWLRNTSATPETGASLTDTLPVASGWTLAIASPANAFTNCANGVVTNTSNSVTITGATIPGGSTATPGVCYVAIDVTATGTAGATPIINTIPAGALTTSNPGVTNTAPATASLSYLATGLTLNKTFGNGGTALGGQAVPMIIQVDVGADSKTNIAFTDNFPAGLVVAPTPNVSTTCVTADYARAPYAWTDGSQIPYMSTTPATVTASPGAASISLSDAYLIGFTYASTIGGNSSSVCTISVDVVPLTTGNKTNTIPAGAVSSSSGDTNASPTSATLTLQANANVMKVFNPSQVRVNQPYTLTFNIINASAASLSDFIVQDALPAGTTATSIVAGSNTCGGNLSITGGGTGVSLVGPGTNVNANSQCSFVVNMVSSTPGVYTNNSSNLTTTPNTLTHDTTTTVTVTDAIDLSVEKSVDSSTPAPYLSGTSQVRLNLLATNNGPAAAQESIVVKDCLPQGLTYVNASGAGWSCVSQSGPTIFGALTCSAQVVCTRNSGTGVLAAGAAASPIQVTASVDSGASGLLTNYTQVNPASNETLLESNPLGTTNGGYEDGNPAADSNNDAKASITPGAPATITVTKAYSGDSTKITVEPSITVTATCDSSGVHTTTFTPPSGGSLSGMIAGENCTFAEAYSGQVLSGGYTMTGSGTFNPSSLALVAGSNALSVTNTITAPAQMDLKLVKTITSSGPYKAGSTVTFQLVATNTGPGVAQAAIVVKDQLPTGLTAVGATGPNWTCSPQTGAAVEITCTRSGAAGTLAAGANAEPITVTATIDNNVDANTTTSLKNLAKVQPAANETLTETNPVGTTNNGYEDGNSATGSNNDTGVDVNLAPVYSLGNRVWFDTSNNGVVDGTEFGIDGVTVQLWAADASGNPTGTAPVATDTTQSSGYYLFKNQFAGDYVVIIPSSNFGAGQVLSGLYSSGTSQDATGALTDTIASTDTTAAGTNHDHGTLMIAASGSVPAASIKSGLYTLGAGQPTGEDGNVTPGRTDTTLDNQSNLTADFGFYSMAIGNKVFMDSGAGGGVANNGVLDGTEPPVIGATVNLYVDANDDGVPDSTTALATTTTDANGNYLFTGLPAGKYIVGVVPPAGSQPSSPVTASGNSAADDGKNHGNPAVGGTVYSTTITLVPGASPTGEANATATAAAIAQPGGIAAGGLSSNLPDANINSTIDFGFVSNTIDLTLAKSVTSTGSYSLGSTVTFNLVATNLGPQAAQAAIVVKDQLPAGLTFVSASGTNWTCLAGGQVITCTRSGTAGTLAAGVAAEAITVTATVNTSTPGSLVNYAQVNTAANETLVESNPLGTTNGGYEDGNSATGSNNDASAPITVDIPNTIDLKLVKTITSSGPYKAGSTVTFQLVATNTGPGVAQAAIVVKDQLPTGLTAVSATGPNWTCSPQTGAAVEITCTRSGAAGTLAAGANAEPITVTATIDAGIRGGNSLQNFAKVSPAANEVLAEINPVGTTNNGYEDGNPQAGSNNDASATVTVGSDVPVAPVPVLNAWQLIALALSLGFLATALQRRR